MSDMQGQPPPTPPMAPAPPSASPASQMGSMLAAFSQTELMIAGGAALLIITDLYSIFFAYGVHGVAWAAAAAAVVMIFARRRMPAAMMGNLQSILVLAAAIVALVALRQVIVDFKFIATPPVGMSVERLIGMAGFYAGSALMTFGGWRLWKGGTA